MAEAPPIDFLLGAGIWVVVGSAFWILRKVILKGSIQVAEEDFEDCVAEEEQNGTAELGRRITPFEAAKKINILRSLDAIAQTIFWVSFPFAMILLGMIIPAEVREVLKKFVSVNTFIGAGLAALFGYIAVFTIWKQHVGIEASHIIRLLLGNARSRD